LLKLLINENRSQIVFTILACNRMTQLTRLLLFSFLVLSSVLVFSQPVTGNDDKVYGNDPLLFNGRTYVFITPPGTGGSQFLFDKFDAQGTIQLRNTSFTNISLNYDVYNQLVILKYIDAISSTGFIEISAAWLETFGLYGSHYEYVSGTDTTKRIYQVLGDGDMKIMYYHHKELLIDTRTAMRNHYFSNAVKEMYVKKDKSLIKYKNNKSFVKAFGVNSQAGIKKYMRKNNIRVKKANDQEMTELINYCNTLTGS